MTALILLRAGLIVLEVAEEVGVLCGAAESPAPTGGVGSWGAGQREGLSPPGNGGLEAPRPGAEELPAGCGSDPRQRSEGWVAVCGPLLRRRVRGPGEAGELVEAGHETPRDRQTRA